MKFKLAFINILTLIRIVGTIVLIPIYHTYGGFYVGILAIICYVTDIIDGVLARFWKCSTFFGALFDSVADKLFTICNFIVLYLITPYAIIPIILELSTMSIQLFKFTQNYNIKSSIFGKFKVWVLAISVVLVFFVSSNKIVVNLSYYELLLFAIVMESITLLTYILEIFTSEKKVLSSDKKEMEIPKSKNKLEHFKNVWLNPKFYLEHKDDAKLKDLYKQTKSNN